MGRLTNLQGPHGGADFLGWCKLRAGGAEIVFEDGVARRMVLRVRGDTPSDARISTTLRQAVFGPRILSQLYDGLRKRAKASERVTG